MIKYAEIAIKGKNRYLFEDALVKQMKLALEPVEGEFTVTKEQGRVYVFCPEKYDFDEAVEALQRVFGIVGISPVVIYEDQGFDQMAEDVVAYMKARYPEYKGYRYRGKHQPAGALHGGAYGRPLQGIHKKSKEILSDHIYGSQRGNWRKNP